MTQGSKDGDSQNMQKNAERLISEAPRRWLDAVVIVLTTVAILAFLGRYLDGIMGTRPWLFISGVVVAFPISQYLVYRSLKNRFKL